ncbi:unnamed protein product [Prorocentrum cordatum]|uniref:Glycosyl transferase family 1 domain-containing protein n=1 Tax=Prorocentrum cordatum TaxID=2364126 RepID=A0ABN9XQ42_9DINO|nr:unnamed protein product [Polarella glacialis]
MLQWAETKYKGRVCGYYGFSPKIERQMIAGSDFLLMPSRYEPCGIPQMCALTYGTIPIVHKTGGLNDSVKSFYDDEASATGFHVYPLDENGMKKVMFDALVLFYRRPEAGGYRGEEPVEVVTTIPDVVRLSRSQRGGPS